MQAKNYFFTSESVTEGHPDKIADQISDAVLDAIIANDPLAHVACEVLIKTGLVVVSGEITTSTYVDIPRITRNTIKDIGYTRAKFGFDGDTCGVVTSISEQSHNIADGVGLSLEARTGNSFVDDYDKQGAGDQGMMFGFACDETPELMPMPIMLAHKLSHRLAEVRKSEVLSYLMPDCKTQVTVEYQGCKPVRIDAVLISAQHKPGVDIEIVMKPDFMEHIVKPILPSELVDYKKLKFYVNPTGSFVIGGPMGDCGLTGRKIIVDTYGGMGRHGGGSFSGKDPSKVDRSAAYAARHLAKNIVAAGLADRCEVMVAYAIGKARPVSIMVNTFDTEKIDPKKINKIVIENFDMRPRAIIDRLNLIRPIYRKTAAYGHFGRNDRDFTWENTDMVEVLKREANL